MIVSKAELSTASPKTKRAVRREFELEHEALECVFAANNVRDFKLMMEARILQDVRFERLPVYRQTNVDAYVRGCLDTIARMNGLPVSQAPDSVQPKPRQPTSRPPKRPSARPSRVVSIGAPGVTFPTIWAVGMRAAARAPERNEP